jgi:hypothetical protein
MPDDDTATIHAEGASDIGGGKGMIAVDMDDVLW